MSQKTDVKKNLNSSPKIHQKSHPIIPTDPWHPGTFLSRPLSWELLDPVEQVDASREEVAVAEPGATSTNISPAWGPRGGAVGFP